jgi:hypothetical protein
MKTAYKAILVLQGGGRYHVPTAQGTMSKAIAEAKKWIAHNRLDGEVWDIRLEVHCYLDNEVRPIEIEAYFNG